MNTFDSDPDKHEQRLARTRAHNEAYRAQVRRSSRHLAIGLLIVIVLTIAALAALAVASVIPA